MNAEADPRPGSTGDLVRRMDSMERKHDDLAKEVTALTSTVATVVVNQDHARELTKLRFDALDDGQKAIKTDVSAVKGELRDFMRRIEGILTGETPSNQQRQGEELVADYKKWREAVDEDRKQQKVLAGQLSILARVATLLIGGNVLGLVIAVYAVLSR